MIVSGNVGIGTTAPAAILNVASSSGSDLLHLDHSANQTLFYVDQWGNTGVRTGTTAYSGSLGVNTGSDTQKGIVIRANSATQTANLFEWQNSTGTALDVVASGGNVGIGTTVPQAMLQIGTGAAGSGQILVPNGSVSAPGYSFTGSTNSGMYSAGTGEYAYQ